ncbi:MAG: DUF6340 family protein [Crocinitomicaceae bacterium]
MKKGYIILFGLLLIGVVACKQSVYLTITQPPAIYLTPDYTTASVVNRSVSSGKKSKIIDILEKGVTLEGNLDVKGAEKTIQGLFDKLKANQQLEQLELLDSLKVLDGGINSFPVPLSWDEVEALCRGNNSRLLFSLEIYDTDTKVDYATTKTTQNTPLGPVPLLRYTATVATVIKMGWRIYDPSQKIILDEFRMSDQMTNTGSGLTPVNALAAVLNREQSVLNLSRLMAADYAERLLEHRIRVWRTYYKSGSNKLKMARRKAVINDWEGAAELWSQDMETAKKRKVIGRATYNMAIYEEVNGNLEKALEYAKKAYGDYNVKIARDYVVKLERRLNQQQYIK